MAGPNPAQRAEGAVYFIRFRVPKTDSHAKLKACPGARQGAVAGTKGYVCSPGHADAGDVRFLAGAGGWFRPKPDFRKANPFHVYSADPFGRVFPFST
jgi:hypothetical protein